MPGFVIIGNSQSRRVRLFQEALSRQGQPVARVIRWVDLAHEGAPEHLVAELVPNDPAMVRIDSFGEDFDVDRALLVRGFEDAHALGAWAVPPDEVRALTYDHGRIFAPRQGHCGFLRVLGEVERALGKRPWLRVLSAPKSIRRLFDKRACAAVFAEVGVPIPRPFGDKVTTPDELRARMAEMEMSRVFVKLSCGSSASCLALYDWHPSRRRDAWLFTSMEIAGANLYNSLRPRRYRETVSIDRLLAFLLREGSHIEEHVPKARIGGKYFDTRMLMIQGEVAFTVVRKSPHPMTNLHLGAVRGTLAELAATVPEDILEGAHDSCCKVFAAHECHQIGVDVMFTAGLDGHRILEANAFGDLLPNLERDGLDVYEWQIKKALERGGRALVSSPP